MDMDSVIQKPVMTGVFTLFRLSLVHTQRPIKNNHDLSALILLKRFKRLRAVMLIKVQCSIPARVCACCAMGEVTTAVFTACIIKPLLD